MTTTSHIHHRAPSGKMPDTVPLAHDKKSNIYAGDSRRLSGPEKALFTTVALGLAGAAFLGFSATQKKEQERFKSAEVEALQEVTSGWNSVVVLREGVALRTAPIMVNDLDTDRNDTVGRRVKKGNVMTLVNPRVYEARDTHLANGVTVADSTTWLVFTKNGTAPASDTPQKDIYWANYSELVIQENNDNRSYVEVYNYTAPNTKSTSSEGSTTFKPGEMSVTSFEDVVEQEHLTQDLYK